jgi:hypothetical protein
LILKKKKKKKIQCFFKLKKKKKHKNRLSTAATAPWDSEDLVTSLSGAGTYGIVECLTLHAVLTEVTGMEATEDYSESFLEAQAGGEVLRVLAHPLGAEGLGCGIDGAGTGTGSARRRAQLAPIKLRDALVARGRASRLGVLLALSHRALTYSVRSAHVKMTADMVDKCWDTMMLFVVFLERCYPDPKEYAALFPSLHELVRTHGVDPGVAFTMLRSALPPTEEIEPLAEGTGVPRELYAAFWGVKLGGECFLWGGDVFVFFFVCVFFLFLFKLIFL